MSGDEEQKGYLNREEAAKVLRQALVEHFESPRLERSRASVQKILERVGSGNETRIFFDFFVDLIQEVKAIIDDDLISYLNLSHVTPLSDTPSPTGNSGSGSGSHSAALPLPNSTSVKGGGVFSPRSTQERIPSPLDHGALSPVQCSSFVSGVESGIRGDDREKRQQRQKRRREAASMRASTEKLQDLGTEALHTAHERDVASLKKSALQVKALDSDPRSIKLVEEQCDEMTRKLSARETAYKKQLHEEIAAYKRQLREFTRLNIELGDGVERLTTTNTTQAAELDLLKRQLTATMRENLSLEAEVQRLHFILRHFGVDDSKSSGEPYYITLNSVVSMLEDNKICFRPEIEHLVSPNSHSDEGAVRQFIAHLPPNLRLLFAAHLHQKNSDATVHQKPSTGTHYYVTQTGEIGEPRSPTSARKWGLRSFRGSRNHAANSGLEDKISPRQQRTRAILMPDKKSREKKADRSRSAPMISSSDKTIAVSTAMRSARSAFLQQAHEQT